MSGLRRFLPALLVVFAFILYLGLQFTAGRKEKYRSVTALSEGSSGMSIFFTLGSRLGEGRVRLLKEPLLKEGTLERTDLFMILSPRQPVSKREGELLRRYVEGGGTVLLSFHDEETRDNLIEGAVGLGVTLDTNEDENFSNGKTVTVAADHDEGLIETGKQYEFYSRLLLASCSSGGVSCYVSRTPIEKGVVYVMTGIPIFANSLIERSDNRSAAFSLLERYPAIAIDEYRHFFTEKSVADLLLEPLFFFPVFGLILLAVLFFLFGRINRNDVSLGYGKEENSRSFHEMNEEILSGLVTKISSRYDLFDKHAAFLRTLFPTEITEINRVLESSRPGEKNLKTGAELLSLHRSIIHKRRGTP